MSAESDCGLGFNKVEALAADSSPFQELGLVELTKYVDKHVNKHYCNIMLKCSSSSSPEQATLYPPLFINNLI
jgi:hypothetical protein